MEQPDSLVHEVRTEIHCHVCSKTFVAELEPNINGKHEIECPCCCHTHYRVIKDGNVTGDRWTSAVDNSGPPVAKARLTWKSGTISAKTSSVALYIRDAWLNRSDCNGH